MKINVAMLSEEEKNILHNLGIMDECGDLKKSDFAEIQCFCHIHTDKDFLSFAALKEKGLINYKETTKTYKNVTLTEEGFKILEEIRVSWKM